MSLLSLNFHFDSILKLLPIPATPNSPTILSITEILTSHLILNITAATLNLLLAHHHLHIIVQIANSAAIKLNLTFLIMIVIFVSSSVWLICHFYTNLFIWVYLDLQTSFSFPIAISKSLLYYLRTRRFAVCLFPLLPVHALCLSQDYNYYYSVVVADPAYFSIDDDHYCKYYYC